MLALTLVSGIGFYRLAEPAEPARPAGQGSLLAEYLAEQKLPERRAYVVRPHFVGGHAHETFGHGYGMMAFEEQLRVNRPLFVFGSALRLRDLRTGEDRILLEDPQGAIRNPCVHYDGQRILFSWRRGGEVPGVWVPSG
jgi:hypothetical protein